MQLYKSSSKNHTEVAHLATPPPSNSRHISVGDIPLRSRKSAEQIREEMMQIDMTRGINSPSNSIRPELF
ncbi:hypothetical protein BGZ76_001365 [Entomortierella beljakovae]|nr:hypothetical protein BGZ76_001365 [Entomortierella beljakovae]